MYCKNLLLLVILCRTFLATSQNLVKNPGFEHHTPVICIGCHPQHEFISHVSNWNNTGWVAQLFSKKYEFKKSETDRGFYKKDYLPRTGDGVVQLSVRGTTALYPRKGGGGSSYLYTQLSKTLVPGNLYRLQMWFKIKNPNVDKSDRFVFLRHFGMELSDKALKADEASQLLRSYTPFLLDTLRSGEWIALDYIVRPTRPLRYLTIGWFEHPLHPIYWRNDDEQHWVYFLVDDISVTPIPQPGTQDSATAIDYPSMKPLKGLQPDTIKNNTITNTCNFPDSVHVYFDTKVDTLNAQARALLDSFVLCLRKDTLEYGLFIRGFTDAIGSEANNLALSTRRAEAVKQYLQTRHRMPGIQLLTSSHGELISPGVLPDHQRRVEIVKSSIRTSDLIYRKVSLYAVRQQNDSAFFWIKEWLKRPESDKILLLFDPELHVLKTDRRWKAIPHLVRQSYQQYTAAATAFEWDSMYFNDQYYRSLPSVLEEMKGYIPAPLDLSLAQQIHIDTLLCEKYVPYVAQRLDKYGWPSPELAGKRAAMVPALILIHSRDLPTRKKYLPQAEAAFKTKKLDPEWYAMLFDRIMLDEKGVQFYATQYVPDKDDPTTYRLAPIENPEQVNERRAAIGMYLKDMSFNWFKVVTRRR